jgi:subtilisin family serine protease
VKRHTLHIAAVLVGAGALALIGAPTGHTDPPADPGTILVKFKKGVDGSDKVKGKGDDPIAVQKTKVVVVKLKDGESVDAALADYRSRPDVEYAEPNDIYNAALDPPSDPSYSSQWALAQIKALAGWSTYPGSYTATGGATVAVVDTGVDATNPDLADGRVLTGSGANCLSGTCTADSAADDNGHGTNVAGVLDASTNDPIGIAGEAFSSPVLPVKVLDATGAGTAGSIAAGIIWAADHGARVVNLSLAGPFSQTICDAVSYASSAGALVVAAAGNSGWNLATYPAACPAAIGVAATDSNDEAASFSNYGSPDVFVSAPGVGIMTTGLGGSYVSVDGTSIAAPYVSGLAALLFSQDSTRTPAVVKTILAETADKVGSGGYGSDPYSTCGTCTWNSSYGYGRIDVGNALNWAGPQFAVSLSGSSTVAVLPGTSGTLNVAVAADSGYAGTIGLSVSGLPADASASFSPDSLAATGSSQVTISAASTIPLGTYPLTITASDGTSSQSVTATLSVAPPSYSLSASPSSATVGQGQSATYAISAGADGGYIGTVGLSVNGLPAGATASFAPSSVTPPDSSQLTVATTSSTPVGTYTLTISGWDGSDTETSTVTLTVVAPDFTIGASPASATAIRGQSTTYGISLASVGGFGGTVALSVTGLPTYASATFTPSSLASPGGSTLTVKTGTSTPVGTYTLTVKGTSGSLVHTTTITLLVVIPDFTVAATPASVSVMQGQSTTFNVSVGAVYGYTGTITMSISGYPSYSTASFSPTTVAAPGSSTLTFKAATTTPLGTYTLTISGTSSSRVVHKATVTVTVLGPDFSVSSAAPSATVLQGQSATYPVSVATVYGFTGNITLTASGYPTGATVSFSPSVVAAPGSSTLTVKAGTTTAVGTYTLTITGTSAARVVRTAKVTLVVNPVGDFTFTSTSSAITVRRGSYFSPYVYLNAQNGFYCTVALSNSLLPAGMTATWSRTSLLVYGTSTLSTYVKLAAASTTAPGTYTVNLLGTCGPIQHTVPLTVTVV